MSDLEVPEPDAAEQAVPVAETAGVTPMSADPEAPVADALEQAMEAPVDEEDAAR